MSEFEQGLANIMGSFIQTELDCVEKQNQEIEQLQQENNQLKEVIEEVREVINGYMPDEEALCKALDEIGFILDKTKDVK